MVFCGLIQLASLFENMITKLTFICCEGGPARAGGREQWHREQWQGTVALAGNSGGREQWQETVAGGREQWQDSGRTVARGNRAEQWHSGKTVAWQGTVAGNSGREQLAERGREQWQGTVAGRKQWQGTVAGNSGRKQWQGTVAGNSGREQWQGTVAGNSGRTQQRREKDIKDVFRTAMMAGWTAGGRHLFRKKKIWAVTSWTAYANWRRWNMRDTHLSYWDVWSCVASSFVVRFFRPLHKLSDFAVNAIVKHAVRLGNSDRLGRTPQHVAGEFVKFIHTTA